MSLNKKTETIHMQTSSNLARKINLQQAEFTMLCVAVFALIINFSLILVKGANVDYAGYLGIALTVCMLSSIGYFYRLSGRSENIASGLLCAAIFIFFSACLSLFNYLLLPLAHGPYDLMLAEWDSLFGYHWPDIMALAAQYPFFTTVLKFAYMSTMLQFAMLIAILGLSGRKQDLHVMITSVTITATLTICFWGLFPTTGTTTIHELPQSLWDQIGPTVDRAYALDLISIVRNGPSVITPTEIRGLIAFPSYHAVLAFTAMYAAWNLRFIGPIFFVVNLLILPSIFVHGGHHFVDLPAGFLMFVLGTVLAKKFTTTDNHLTVTATNAVTQSKPNIA